MFKKLKPFVPRDYVNIGIVGLGLIGGSIAKKLRATKKYNIIGVDTDHDTLEYCFDNDIIQLGHKDAAILRGCSIVFVCVPAAETARTIARVYDVVKSEALVTDVASVKGEIVKNLPKNIRYLGGHPMCGREVGGIKNAVAALTENCYYLLTKIPSTRDADVTSLETVIADLGAFPLVMTAEEHDRAVSKVSHLPHMVAFSLVNTALSDATTSTIAAGGFRDITRIASSDPAFWQAVTVLNRENILKDIDAFLSNLRTLRDCIANGETASVLEIFETARAKREAIDKKARSGVYRLHVDIADAPNSLARLATVLGRERVNISNISVPPSREGEGGAICLEFVSEDDYCNAKIALKRKKYSFSAEEK